MTEPIGPADEQRRQPAGRGRNRDATLVAAGVLGVLLVWFAIDNTDDVDIHFWVHTARAPLVVVIVIAGLLGALVALLVRRRRRTGSPSSGRGHRN